MAEIHDGVIESLMPADTLEKIGWVSCLSWAVSEPEIVKRFQADTGIQHTPPASGLDAMIDQATGRDTEIVRKFVEWFNANIWGGESNE